MRPGRRQQDARYRPPALDRECLYARSVRGYYRCATASFASSARGVIRRHSTRGHSQNPPRGITGRFGAGSFAESASSLPSSQSGLGVPRSWLSTPHGALVTPPRVEPWDNGPWGRHRCGLGATDAGWDARSIQRPATRGRSVPRVEGKSAPRGRSVPSSRSVPWHGGARAGARASPIDGFVKVGFRH